MDLFVKFRKDYFNYLISIILPALITGISIPVFKHLLGAKGYGNFSIWFNAILILNSILSGWITQSIILFYQGSANKRLFSKHALILSGRTQAVFFIPVLLIIWHLSHDFLLAVLCSLVLLATSIQFSIPYNSIRISLKENYLIRIYKGGNLCCFRGIFFKTFWIKLLIFFIYCSNSILFLFFILFNKAGKTFF